jgi:nucleoid DNA-binding protein
MSTYYGSRLSAADVRRVIDETLATIIATTLQGENVRLSNFGEFRPIFQEPHLAYNPHIRGLGMTRPTIRVGFRSSKTWRLSLRLSLHKREMKNMEKYGYEPEKKDPKVKEAATSGTCPVCGEKLEGKPPACPIHGSKPFERRERNGL